MKGITLSTRRRLEVEGALSGPPNVWKRAKSPRHLRERGEGGRGAKPEGGNGILKKIFPTTVEEFPESKPTSRPSALVSPQEMSEKKKREVRFCPRHVNVHSRGQKEKILPVCTAPGGIMMITQYAV